MREHISIWWLCVPDEIQAFNATVSDNQKSLCSKRLKFLETGQDIYSDIIRNTGEAT